MLGCPSHKFVSLHCALFGQLVASSTYSFCQHLMYHSFSFPHQVGDVSYSWCFIRLLHLMAAFAKIGECPLVDLRCVVASCPRNNRPRFPHTPLSWMMFICVDRTVRRFALFCCKVHSRQLV
jgi:hypothetical protein